MRCLETLAPAGCSEPFLSVVDARFTQYAVKLPAYPCLDICIVHRLAELILRGVAVYAVACLAAVFIKRFCVPDEILYTYVANLVSLPCNARLTQLRLAVQSVLVVCNPGVHDALACRLQLCLCQPVAGLQLHIHLCQLLCTDFLRIVLQRLVAETVPDFLLQHRLDVFPLFCKICSPYRVIFCHLFGKLRFVHRGHFVHAAADDTVTGEDAARHLICQLRDLLLCGASGLVVHFPLDDCVCRRRRPGVAAIDFIAAISFRVDCLARINNAGVPVLGMSLLCVHNSNRRGWNPSPVQGCVSDNVPILVMQRHEILCSLGRTAH